MSTSCRAQEPSLLFMMKKGVLVIVVLVVVIVLAGPLLVRTEERTQLKMGTFVKITLCGHGWLDFDTGFKEAFAAVDRVDAMASVYNEDSEVARLNRTADKNPVVVSEDLFGLIKEAVRLSRDSHGAFDITVGPLVELWRSYKSKGSIPSADEINEALSSVGYDKLILDGSKKSVYFTRDGMAIDLSAMAKGYAVDGAVEALKKAGFKSAIVNAGGDLYCLGRRDFFRRWRIGIIDPKDKSRIIRLLYLSDKAVATSGGYEQYFRHRNKDYTHLIDPKTGYPKESRFFSVTVIAPDCTLADGVATAVSVGGEPVKNKLKKIYPDIDIIIRH